MLYSRLLSMGINIHRVIHEVSMYAVVYTIFVCGHTMMTSSNEKNFRVIGHLYLCGEFAGEFPAQRPVTRSFDVSCDLRLKKRLSKQWRGWWFWTPSRPLWRHCNTVAVDVSLERHGDQALKRKCRVEESVVTDCTKSCHLTTWQPVQAVTSDYFVIITMFQWITGHGWISAIMLILYNTNQTIVTKHNCETLLITGETLRGPPFTQWVYLRYLMTIPFIVHCPRWFPQRPVRRDFDVFFDLQQNLSKQLRLI